jgi:hypothetical protein
MASTITAGNATNSGLIVSPDNTGALEIKTGSGAGTTAISIDSSQNVNFSGTAQRITGDFSNATFANRVMFQTSTANSNSQLGLLPSGTGNSSNFAAHNTSDPTNASRARIQVSSTVVSFESDITGTGTYLPMTFYTGGSERMRVATDGVTTVGQNMTAQFPTQLSIADSTHATSRRAAIRVGSGWLVLQDSNGDGTKDFSIYDGTAAAQRFRIDTSGNLQFNSGYGSVATVYGCRAWVNFNGTGTVAIRNSGNVSSITDNGTGNYTINFTNAMPDVNYSWVGSCGFGGTSSADGVGITLYGAFATFQLAGSFRTLVTDYGNNTAYDVPYIGISVFR